MTWDEAVATGLCLPGVERSTSYGTPALKVGGKLLVRLRPEDDSIVLTGIPPEEAEALIADQPAVFHTTPHYAGHAVVLARLPALDLGRFKALLDRRWRALAPRRRGDVRE